MDMVVVQRACRLLQETACEPTIHGLSSDELTLAARVGSNQSSKGKSKGKSTERIHQRYAILVWRQVDASRHPVFNSMLGSRSRFPGMHIVQSEDLNKQHN